MLICIVYNISSIKMNFFFKENMKNNIDIIWLFLTYKKSWLIHKTTLKNSKKSRLVSVLEFSTKPWVQTLISLLMRKNISWLITFINKSTYLKLVFSVHAMVSFTLGYSTHPRESDPPGSGKHCFSQFKTPGYEPITGNLHLQCPYIKNVNTIQINNIKMKLFRYNYSAI